MALQSTALQCTSNQPLVLVGGRQEWFGTEQLITLNQAEVAQVEFAVTLNALKESVAELFPALVLVHSRMNIFWAGVQEFLSDLRQGDFRGSIVILTDDPSSEDFVHAWRSGVDDYLYLGPNLNLIAELERLLKARRHFSDTPWDPDSIAQSGFFRSLGLSDKEINILIEYARDFPGRRELAARLGKSEVYLRKCFSRIYSKLRDLLAVENQAQLAHLLTICCL